MASTTRASGWTTGAGDGGERQAAVRIPVVALGMSLGLFLAITYMICIAFDLMFPGMAMYQTWLKLLPGFTWLSWPSFLLGLVESFAYGWYVALVFGPLFNVCAARWR